MDRDAGADYRPAASDTKSSGAPPNQVPHSGGPIVSGSATVLIGGRPAARAGDANAENQASATVLVGAPSVLIGP